jgi:hypothetical protein
MHSKCFICQGVPIWNIEFHLLVIEYTWKSWLVWMLQLARITYMYIGQLMHSKSFNCGNLICMNLQELLMFIFQFNAFKELNFLRCVWIWNNCFHPLPIVSLVENPFFQLTRFQLDVIFNYVSIVIFWIFKNFIHNFQLNWATYLFGGWMKVNPKYFGVHGIFLTPP